MIWTEESAALLWRAYQYGLAAKTVADWIEPYLKPGARICDAGCGVGALSLALAQRGFSATALDISEIALSPLRQSTDAERICIRCEDAYAHAPDAPYDAMVFSFFGSMEQCLHMAARCCSGDVFYISRDYDMHCFSAGKHPVSYRGYRDACALLDALGVAYEAKECALNMGQPFADFSEARRFFSLYSRDDPKEITDEFLCSRLVPSGDKDYPLYLPHMRRAGMVHIHTKNIPQSFADV